MPWFALVLLALLAVAAVALPHALATALRWWRRRDAVDRTVLRRLGLLSAAGGLVGALGCAVIGGRGLTLALGALLLRTAAATLGGLAGNQGGLRAAALGAFGPSPRTFLATATATGPLVDAARTPVYLRRAGDALLGAWLAVDALRDGHLPAPTTTSADR